MKKQEMIRVEEEEREERHQIERDFNRQALVNMAVPASLFGLSCDECRVGFPIAEIRRQYRYCFPRA